MKLAHILGGHVHALYTVHEPWMPDYDIRDVSGVAGIEPGWEAKPDGSFAPVAPPDLSVADLVACVEAIHASVLAAGIEVNVAAEGEPEKVVLCDGTNGTRASLALLALYGQINPLGTKLWIDNTGRPSALSGAECVALATRAGEWISGTYPVLAEVVGAIRATPPGITTRSQIESAFA